MLLFTAHNKYFSSSTLEFYPLSPIPPRRDLHFSRGLAIARIPSSPIDSVRRRYRSICRDPFVRPKFGREQVFFSTKNQAYTFSKNISFRDILFGMRYTAWIILPFLHLSSIPSRLRTNILSYRSYLFGKTTRGPRLPALRCTPGLLSTIFGQALSLVTLPVPDLLIWGLRCLASAKNRRSGMARTGLELFAYSTSSPRNASSEIPGLWICDRDRFSLCVREIQLCLCD